MILYLSICILIIAATRFLAYWGIHFLKDNPITLIEGVLNLTYVENTGAAFGMFNKSTSLLSIIGIIFFIVITYLVASKKFSSKSYIIALSFLAGGGIANVCDRIKFGFVVDYIDFCLINYPVFNLADICVVVSCIFIFIKILFSKDEEKNDGNEDTESTN